MKTIVKLAAALILSAAAPVLAASPALIGWAEPGAPTSCFTRVGAAGAGGGLRNSCATTQTWYIPFHIATSGTKSLVAQVYRPAANVSVCCYARSLNADGSIYSQTSCVPTPSSSLLARLNLGSQYVPEYGALYVACNVGPGASVISATY